MAFNTWSRFGNESTWIMFLGKKNLTRSGILKYLNGLNQKPIAQFIHRRLKIREAQKHRCVNCSTPSSIQPMGSVQGWRSCLTRALGESCPCKARVFFYQIIFTFKMPKYIFEIRKVLCDRLDTVHT